MKHLVAVFLLVAAPAAMAGVGVHWYTIYGGYDHASPDVTGTEHYLLEGHSAIWQLIYAGANNVVDAPNQNNPANGWAGGDDFVWFTRTIPQNGGIAPEDGTEWDTRFRNICGNLVYEDLSWDQAGYMYQRIYEGTPAEGSWYFDGYLLAVDVNYTGDINDRLPIDYNVDTPWSGFQPEHQITIIPEPATTGLVLFGTAVLSLRRRRER